MSAVDVITAAGAGVGMITGGIGVAFALRADRRAKKANENAQAANSIAEAANRIAEDANQFALESNAITRRQAAQQNEHWVVNWTPKWEKEGALLVLLNKGSHTARQPTVLIQGRDIHQVYDGLDDVDPGHKLSLAVPEIVEQRNKKALENQRTYAAAERAGYVIGLNKFSGSLTITVTWRTGEDALGQQVLQQKVA